MRPLTEAQIRASFINASQRERRSLTLPAGFADIPWDRRDYLGWRDPKLPLVGYVVAELDGEPVGLLLKQTESKPRSRPQCSWCSDITLPNDVVLYSTKRAGDAGRRGDTVGTLVCADFECSVNVRKRPTEAYLGFDIEAARQRRIATLQANVDAFVRSVRDGS